jgi:hypothetical protein
VIDELKSRGYAVEGEIGYELGPNGLTRRANVKFKPSEGIISKVANRSSLNINLNADLPAAAAAVITKTIS